MTLPVSSYEELLVQVRELTHETILLQRQLSSDLYDNTDPPDVNHNFPFARRHEKGKLFTDNVIRQCEPTRKNEGTQAPVLLESSNHTFHSRFFPNLEASESIRSGELTSRLLAWRSRSHQRIISQEEAEAREKHGPVDRLPRENEGRTALYDSRGVGTPVEGALGSRGAPPRRPHRIEPATPLANVVAAQQHHHHHHHNRHHHHHHLLHHLHHQQSEQQQRELESSADVAASQAPPQLALSSSTASTSLGPVVAALAAASSTTSNSTTFLSTSSTSTSSSASSSRCTPAKRSSHLTNGTDQQAARQRLYLPTNLTTNETVNKEDVMEPEVKEEDERRSSTPSPEFYARRNKRYNEDASSEEENKLDPVLQAHRMPSSYRGTWPIRRDLWANQQIGFTSQQGSSSATHNIQEMPSIMSFSSNSGATLGCSTEMQGHRRLGAKVDVVYNLLGMLGSTEGREDMSATLLSMSNSIDSCLVMRQSGCLPLLVHLIHAPGQDPETRERASRALHNVVHAKSDERAGRREARVLRFLEQLRDYCQTLRASLETGQVPDDLERHPGPTIAALMKLSFDEAHRHAMCQLGGLHAVAELIEMDHLAHGSECDDQNCITLRRYAGMALTNLTFGDGNNKALLCSFREFMKALVSQLRSPSDDLRQVTASVLRNLSWRADGSSKETLTEVGAVIELMKAAMEGRKEATLKSILSALWNLTAHCSTNKVDICAVEGALAFLVDMLSYKAPSKTLAIVENAGGILRNVSSHVAVREDYRAIIRERGCLQVLLQQLRSPSLTVVSNACGALWNLSAMCPQDQRLLLDLGAVPMLRSLVQSKHKLISMGSSAALKNLLSARPGCGNLVHLDSTARGLGLPTLPTLVARKQKALEQEIDQKLPETCDNIEPSTSPTNKDDKFAFKLDHSFLGINSRALRTYQLHQPSTSGVKCNEVSRSESRESMRSVTSTHSDTMFERVNRHVLNGMSPTDTQIKQQSSSLHSAVGFDTNASSEAHTKTPSEKKYTLRYKNAVPERFRAVDGTLGEKGELMCANSTISWASAPNQESACSQIFMHSSVEDNLSVTNHSALSSTKSDSQCSITAEPDTAVALKQEYQANGVKSPIAACASLPYLKDPLPVSEVIGYSNSYTDNNLLLQHDPLDTLQKAISPTIGHAPKGDLFNNYAETDLDQPTDYSLRYAESTMEEDEKQPLSLDLIHEDTVKTYYTEGTPRATSLNSSRATSASDLQDDNRVKNSMKKLLDGSKLQRVEQNEEPSTSEEAKELNGEPGTDTDLNLCTQQQSLHYFNCNDPPPDFKQIKDTPVADVVPSKSMEIKPDTLREFDGKGVFENESHGNKDLSTSDISNYAGNAASKTSNDSGYQVSDGDEDDEDLLAACINIGMQNNRHRHSFIGNSFEKLPRAECNLTRYQTSIALDQVESNEPVDPSSDTFNKKQAESNEVKLIADATKESSEMTLNKTEYNFNITKEDDAHSNIFLDPRCNWQDQSQLQCLVKEVSTSTTDSSTASTMVTAKGSSECNWDLYIQANLDTTENALEELVSAKKLNDIRVVLSECVLNASIETETTDNVTDLIKRSYSDIKMDSESSESIDSVERSEHALLELCIQPGVQKSGNAVVRDNTSDSEREDILNRTYTKESSFSRDEDDTMKRVSKKGSDKSSDVVDNSGSENTFAKHEKEDVYRRQRDPDAMIASLDRLTAALVQQTEAMRERDSSTMKQSTASDTWNEDSPNDVSFPSISMSAPLIASFKSDVPEDQANVLSELVETESSEHAGMTDSKIIQREAIKLAEAVDAEANKDLIDLDTTSMTSVDLDAIKPPSAMGSLISLTASYAGLTDSNETFVNRDRCHSTSLPPVQMKIQGTADSRNCRKKSLPLGVVARRALCHGQNSHSNSLENILNDCTNSHLDNVKPPSMMDELPDVGDMENSMLSVASITSEIADSKDHDSHSLTGSDPVFDLLKPVANVLSLTCMRYAEAMQTSANNSMSECLENINPPSLFNEVNEMDESTMEATNTLCSDTLCIDTELHTDDISHTLVMDKVEEAANDTDEGATPLSSEYCLSSSAESTPRKRLNKNHLTPKQKRNLAKERYRTYTIAAEFVKKEEEQRRKQENACGDGNKIPRGKCSPFSKLTPKQRRQEDRARFQTQVLENPFPDPGACLSNKQEEADEGNREEIAEKSLASTAAKSSIPTFTKLPICKALRKKRMENDETKERYRTRTLSDTDRSPKDSETTHTTNANILERQSEGIHGINLEDMQHMLEQNATIVINSLNESSRNNDSVGDDLLLDCETISLVSNDSESERSLRMRFVNGLSKKLMNSQQSDSGQRFYTDAEQPEEIPEPVNAYEDCNGAQPAESENEDSSSNCPEEQPRETKRPRIVKPGMASRDLSADSNATDRSEPGSPKAIRGRRKALYSNPITRKSTPQVSPMKQANPISGIPIGRSNTSPIVRATRATTLRQNNNSPNYVGKDAPKSNIGSKVSSPATDTDKRTKSIAIASKRASVPQKGSSLTFTRPSKRHSTPPTCSSNFPNESKAEPLKPLERQGTFTKEESEVQNAPTVPATCPPAKTKIAKPIRSAVSKVHPAISKSKISVRTHQSFQSKIAKANSTEKIQTEKTLPILMAGKRNLPPVAARIPSASEKPVSGIPSAVGQNESARTFRKMGPLGQRSNSNSSIVSNSSTSPPNRKATKEATSKIASLWKKVEESKSKQRFEKPDTRQWITASNSAAQDEAPAAVGNPPTFRLFRSSTFEGVPHEETQLGKAKSKKTMIVNMPTNGAKYRNSCDLSGMHASEAPCKIPVKSTDVNSRSRDIVDSTVILRRQQQPVASSGDSEIDIAKRISRLGSFIRVDSTNPEGIAQIPVSNGVRAPTSAIVPPFNYNPRQDTVPHVAKNRSDDVDNKFDASDCHAEIVTGSTRVTTV